MTVKFNHAPGSDLPWRSEEDERGIGRLGRSVRLFSGRRQVALFQADGLALAPRLDLANHSPTGFEWNYLGSGPAQLALALCADALGDDARALRVYQEFKANVVANLAEGHWRLTAAEVREEVAEIEALRASLGR